MASLWAPHWHRYLLIFSWATMKEFGSNNSPDFFSSKVSEVKTSSAYWKLVKDATNLSKSHTPIGPLKREDGSLAVCDVEKANMMNAYFSSIGTTLASQLPANLSALQLETGTEDDSTDIPTLAVIDIQEGTVKSKIQNLKTNKATGPDEVAPRFKTNLIHLKDYTVGQQESSSISLRIYRQWKSSPGLNGTL